MDEATLAETLWPPGPATESKFVTPDFSYIHEQLKHKGVTRQLLWDEYCQQHPGQAYQYTKFCTLYGQWRLRLKPQCAKRIARVRSSSLITLGQPCQWSTR